jgi:N,N-dimethyl phenylurea N-demethylase beta subunit
MTETIDDAKGSAHWPSFLLAHRFLALEAKLLDERRFEEWLELLDDDIVYEVPLRQTKSNYRDEHPENAFHIRDSKALIKNRVDRLKSGFAWSETPPSRTLRLLGNVFVSAIRSADVIEVESAMLLYRQRGTDATSDVIPVRRRDVIRFAGEHGKLLSRRAELLETVMHTPNLGIFL